MCLNAYSCDVLPCEYALCVVLLVIVAFCAQSIAAATGATLGACLTRGAGSSQRQRQDTSSKRQVDIINFLKYDRFIFYTQTL